MNRKRRLRLPKILTSAESEAFRSVIANPRDGGGVSLMLDGGLRVSDVAKLKLQSLIWNERILRFITKGDREAEIPISNRLRDELEKLIRARPPEATHEFVLWDLKNPSKPISRYALYKMVRRYGVKAGIQKRVHPHMLRHTYATELYKSTRDPLLVKQALIHKNLNTVPIYAELSTDDLRNDFESIDRRPLLMKWWSRLKPKVIPELLKPKPRPFYIGETIGREKQITHLRKNFRDRVNTILVGDRGTGKRHLLSQVDGEGIYRIDSFTPVRESLVKLCEKLVKDSLLEEMPKGRSATPFAEALKEAGKTAKLTLVISSLNDITRNEIRHLRAVAENWTIFGSVEGNQKEKLGKIFFGKYSAIELENFDKATAEMFTRKLVSDVNVPDMKAYLNHAYSQTRGNPQAILELTEATIRTGNIYPEHSGMQKVLSATPFLSMFLMAIIASRYSAAAISRPDWKIFATILMLGIIPFLILDRILKQKNK